jgi:TonB family protein
VRDRAWICFEIEDWALTVGRQANECFTQNTYTLTAFMINTMIKSMSSKICRTVSILACAFAVAHMFGDLTFADTQPKRIAVDGKTQRSKLTHEVAAKYPPEARENRIEGVVHLKATVATDGTVKELEAISGQPLLVKAAMEAVRQWRYEPTMLRGEPVEVVTRIAVVFKLP